MRQLTTTLFLTLLCAGIAFGSNADFEKRKRLPSWYVVMDDADDTVEHGKTEIKFHVSDAGTNDSLQTGFRAE